MAKKPTGIPEIIVTPDRGSDYLDVLNILDQIPAIPQIPNVNVHIDYRDIDKTAEEEEEDSDTSLLLLSTLPAIKREAPRIIQVTGKRATFDVSRIAANEVLTASGGAGLGSSVGGRALGPLAGTVLIVFDILYQNYVVKGAAEDRALRARWLEDNPLRVLEDKVIYYRPRS